MLILLFLNHDAKVRKKIHTCKFFVLKNVNYLKIAHFVRVPPEGIRQYCDNIKKESDVPNPLTFFNVFSLAVSGLLLYYPDRYGSIPLSSVLGGVGTIKNAATLTGGRTENKSQINTYEIIRNFSPKAPSW